MQHREMVSSTTPEWGLSSQEKTGGIPRTADESFYHWALAKVPIQPLPRATKQISLEKFIHLMNTAKGRPTKEAILVKYRREMALVKYHGMQLLQYDKRYSAYKESMRQHIPMNMARINGNSAELPKKPSATYDILEPTQRKGSQLSMSSLLNEDNEDTEVEMTSGQESVQGPNSELDFSTASISEVLNVSKSVEKSLERTLQTLAHYMALEVDSKIMEQQLYTLQRKCEQLSLVLQTLNNEHQQNYSRRNF